MNTANQTWIFKKYTLTIGYVRGGGVANIASLYAVDYSRLYMKRKGWSVTANVKSLYKTQHSTGARTKYRPE